MSKQPRRLLTSAVASLFAGEVVIIFLVSAVITFTFFSVAGTSIHMASIVTSCRVFFLL